MESPGTPDLLTHYPSLAKITMRDSEVSGRHGPVPVRSYRESGGGTQPGLVWFHGGGFIGGDLDMPCAHWVALAIAADGFAVVSGDYAKCLDGVHYPVPNDDVLDVWLWAVKNATALGMDGSEIHLGGASAGAALAASLAKRLRDGAGQTPKSVILAYPVVHEVLAEPEGELREVLQEATGFVITPEIAESITSNYIGSANVNGDPYAFAANGDLSGLSPTFILNSEIDTLRVSGEAYGAALGRAGVEVVTEYEPGATHGHLNEPFTAHGEHSLARMALWLRSHSSV
jgi:acetyl esterase